MGRKRTSKNRINEVDMLNHMLTSLVELLEEKGMLTHEEWEERIRKKIEDEIYNELLAKGFFDADPREIGKRWAYLYLISLIPFGAMMDILVKLSQYHLELTLLPS